MVRLAPGQRAVFGEKVLDLGNYAAAALVFGQFGWAAADILDGDCVWRRYLARIRSVGLLADGRTVMENAFGILWGIALVIGIIAFLDWLGRRKDRRSRNRAA